MLSSSHQNAGQNWDIEIANRSFENVTVQISGNDSNKPNLILEEIKRRFSFGKAVQSLGL
jgi:hypothetical protein